MARLATEPGAPGPPWSTTSGPSAPACLRTRIGSIRARHCLRPSRDADDGGRDGRRAQRGAEGEMPNAVDDESGLGDGVFRLPTRVTSAAEPRPHEVEGPLDSR